MLYLSVGPGDLWASGFVPVLVVFVQSAVVLLLGNWTVQVLGRVLAGTVSTRHCEAEERMLVAQVQNARSNNERCKKGAGEKVGVWR